MCIFIGCVLTWKKIWTLSKAPILLVGNKPTETVKFSHRLAVTYITTSAKRFVSAP